MVYMRGDVHAQYTVTSLIAADIFTTGFTDARKWTSLCEQINVAPLSRFDKEDLQRVHHMFKNNTLNRSKRNRDDGVARMPPGCESRGSKAGWHDADPCYYVVKEPQNHKMPPKTVKEKFTWRSTWLQKAWRMGIIGTKFAHQRHDQSGIADPRAGREGSFHLLERAPLAQGGATSLRSGDVRPGGVYLRGGEHGFVCL